MPKSGGPDLPCRKFRSQCAGVLAAFAATPCKMARSQKKPLLWMRPTAVASGKSTLVNSSDHVRFVGTGYVTLGAGGAFFLPGALLVVLLVLLTCCAGGFL